MIDRCVAYLASVDIIRRVPPNLEEILIARKFFDIFSNELPRISSDQKIFFIDLVISTIPISKALY